MAIGHSSCRIKVSGREGQSESWRGADWYRVVVDGEKRSRRGKIMQYTFARGGHLRHFSFFLFSFFFLS